MIVSLENQVILILSVYILYKISVSKDKFKLTFYLNFIQKTYLKIRENISYFKLVIYRDFN